MKYCNGINFIETCRKDISIQDNVTAALTYTCMLNELFCDSLTMVAEFDESSALDVPIMEKWSQLFIEFFMQNHFELNNFETKQNQWFKIMIHAALKV